MRSGSHARSARDGNARAPGPACAAIARILRAIGLRIVIAEDSFLVREALLRLLAGREGIEVVAACEDLDSLIAAVDEHSPDVVVADIRMPPGERDEGIVAARRLRDSHPDTGVVVLSQYSEPEYALALLEAGAARRAYLLKERVSDADQLFAAIREVAQGGSLIDPKVVEELVAERARAEASPLAELTERERDVLAEMARGRNNAAIAAALVVSDRAVEKHISSIFMKLGLNWEEEVHRRVKAVLLYLAEPGG